MIKDKNKYASTGGWGYGRWLGEKLKPYEGKNGLSAEMECYGCHTLVKNNDYVFTKPAIIP